MEEIVHVNTGSNRVLSITERVEEENFEVGDDIRTLMMNSGIEGSSFTALLELSSTEAFQLLHRSNFEDITAGRPCGVSEIQNCDMKSLFCSTITAQNADISSAREDSPDSSSVPSNSSANSGEVKNESPDTDSNRRSSSPFSSDPVQHSSLATKKRKEREKKSKSSVKNVRTAHETSDETVKLPYVHVRARRGQATDSHSLAERARREKINARMKLLQELVPGCSKISGTALVLDEIINHVQYLQRQVEVLSMKLATVSPRTDLNIERLFVTEGMQSGTRVGGNVCNMFVPFVLGEGQYRQPWQVDDANAGLHFPMWERNEEMSLVNREHSETAASLHFDRGSLDI